MQSAHCAMSYVLCIGLERTRWISNGYGYPSDLDMVTIFRPWIFHGWAGTTFMDMDMDLILFNPIQTRPIAILTLEELHDSVVIESGEGGITLDDNNR